MRSYEDRTEPSNDSIESSISYDRVFPVLAASAG
jgi:hypothetical protein